MQVLTSGSPRADFETELWRLNREQLSAFTDMLDAVAQRPAQSARSVELVGILARYLQHLLNSLRPHQVSRRWHMWCASIRSPESQPRVALSRAS